MPRNSQVLRSSVERKPQLTDKLDVRLPPTVREWLDLKASEKRTNASEFVRTILMALYYRDLADEAMPTKVV